MYSKRFNIFKLGTCTAEASIQWSDKQVLTNLQFSEILYNFLRCFNTVNLGTCNQKASIQCIQKHVEIQFSKVYQLKNIQYIEVEHMYLRILNTVKWGTCTQEASIQWIWGTCFLKKALMHWSEEHVIKMLQFIELR